MPEMVLKLKRQLSEKLLAPGTNRINKELSEDDFRKKLVVEIVLLISILFLTILEIDLLYQYFREHASNADFINPLPFTLIYLLFISLYLLSRRGYFKVVAYSLVILYLAATTYAAWRWGPDLYQVVVSYALIITLSGIVIGSRFSFLSATLISLAIILANYLDLNGIIHIDRGWKDESLVIDDTLVISLTFLMIALISWLSNREIEKSLKRARRSETALREQNLYLEKIVEAKTKELRQTQVEKVNQLYRFAEFGRLSSGLFHDLMNPLSAISINVNEINSDFHPKLPEFKQYLNRAVRASEKMDRFIGVVKNQIRKEEINEKFSLNEVVNESLMLLDYLAKKKNIKLLFLPSKNVRSFGNPLKFQQIITNLVSNAIDAFTEKTSNRKVEIKLNSHDGEIVLEVRDYGAGITAEIIPKIFDPFFTTKSENGVGLGLSTTKEAVEKDFGGSITVTSEQSGTAFIISFPQRDSS